MKLFPLNPLLSQRGHQWPPGSETDQLSDDPRIQSLTSHEAQCLIILCINQESKARFFTPSASFSPSTGCERWTGKGKPWTRKENPPAFLNVGAPHHRSGAEQQRSLCFDLILIDFQLTGVSTPLLPLLSHSSQLRPNHLEGTQTTTTEPVLCFNKHAKNK